MEELANKGLAKAIGISNFTIFKTENLLKTAKIVPAVNQGTIKQNQLLATNTLFFFFSQLNATHFSNSLNCLSTAGAKVTRIVAIAIDKN